MKKLSITFGVFLTFILIAVNGFPASLKFDFDGDPNTWETEWSMDIGDTVEVDVWLEGYTGDVVSVTYGLCNGKETCVYNWGSSVEPSSVSVVDAWPYDTDVGGPWSPSRSYAHFLSDGKYWYKVGSETSDLPIPVTNKMKLHTIELEKTEDYDSIIGTFSVLGGNDLLAVLPNGATQFYGLTQTTARIRPTFDCEIEVIPQTASVFTWETVQFSATVDGICFDLDPDPSCYTWEIAEQESTGSTISATGLYTAGANEGTDIIRVTDTCNNDISDTATVTVSMSPTTTTTTSVGPIPGPGPGPTTTTTVIPLGKQCITDKSCNDGIFCNGEERCVPIGEDAAVYSWSASLAGSTGTTGNTGKLGICQSGEVPCPNDGLYCTGEESCDEEKQVCLSTGDPCAPEGLLCDEEDDICRPGCVDDDDCEDDGLFCNGEEICINGSCGHSGDPCPAGTTCVEETDQCTSSVPITITATPDPILRSRWIMIPAFIIIAGEDTSFSQLTSQVNYNPSNALLPMPALVLGPELIWQLVFVNPPWLAGNPGDPQTVKVTVDEVMDEFEIKLLPFILDQK